MNAVATLDISRAISYTKERERQADADRRANSLPALAMADCIASGLAGRALTDALSHHFPDAKRADTYLAVGLALALLQADLTLAEMEMSLLRNEGGRS
jgi:regulator of protease activity HflC (stomatin/prohibitin superfamily)